MSENGIILNNASATLAMKGLLYVADLNTTNIIVTQAAEY